MEGFDAISFRHCAAAKEISYQEQCCVCLIYAWLKMTKLKENCHSTVFFFFLFVLFFLLFFVVGGWGGRVVEGWRGLMQYHLDTVCAAAKEISYQEQCCVCLIYAWLKMTKLKENCHSTVFILFNTVISFIPEFLKWKLPSLNLIRTIVLKKGLSQKSKQNGKQTV